MTNIVLRGDSGEADVIAKQDGFVIFHLKYYLHISRLAVWFISFNMNYITLMW